MTPSSIGTRRPFHQLISPRTLTNNTRTGIQSEINSVPHFKRAIEYNGDSYLIHFAALFSSAPSAIPLVLIHGWPGSFLEFLPLLNILQQKYSPENLPYHIIVPSMPGYTFSSGPPVTASSFTVLDTCEIFRQLLHSLGFSKENPYVVQGGDIGSRVARGLSVLDEACCAVHLNFCFDLPMKKFPLPKDLSASEVESQATIDSFIKSGTGYGLMHATRPSTISLILSSNPVALLAWLGEKYITWSDEPHLSLTTILTFVTVYWITDTFPRSIYPYRNDFDPKDEVPCHGGNQWHVPSGKGFGFSAFPGEMLPVPRVWVEKTMEDEPTHMWWKEHESGGHFAALEKPGEMLRDLEEFVEYVKKGKQC